MTFRERLRGELILIPASYVGAPCAPAFAQTYGNVSLNFCFRPKAEVRSMAAVRQLRTRGSRNHLCRFGVHLTNSG